MRRISLILLVVYFVITGSGCSPNPTRPAAEVGNRDDIERLVSTIPESKLTIPRDQIRYAREINERFLLLEQVQSRDNAFFLYDKAFNELECIVGFIENAVFEGMKNGKLIFMAKRDGDCGDFSFPYRLVYDLNSRKPPTAEPVYFPLRQAIAFGSTGAWKQILFNIKADGESFVFEFKPREGEVLAGGHKRPLTTVGYDSLNNELVLRFYNVELSPEFLGERRKSAAVSGHNHVKGYRVEALQAGVAPGDTSVLKEDLPYGLNLRDTQNLANRPSVKVYLRLKEAGSYSVLSMSNAGTGGSTSTLKYIVSFKGDE